MEDHSAQVETSVDGSGTVESIGGNGVFLVRLWSGNFKPRAEMFALRVLGEQHTSLMVIGAEVHFRGRLTSDPELVTATRVDVVPVEANEPPVSVPRAKRILRATLRQANPFYNVMHTTREVSGSINRAWVALRSTKEMLHDRRVKRQVRANFAAGVQGTPAEQFAELERRFGREDPEVAAAWREKNIDAYRRSRRVIQAIFALEFLLLCGTLATAHYVLAFLLLLFSTATVAVAINFAYHECYYESRECISMRDFMRRGDCFVRVVC